MAKWGTGTPMMPGSSNSIKFCVISIGVLFLALGACGGNTNAVKENEARNSTRSQAQRDMNQGLGGKNREEGSLFGPGGLFGSKADKQTDTGTGVAENASLRRGPRRTINFIPRAPGETVGRAVNTHWETPGATPH